MWLRDILRLEWVPGRDWTELEPREVLLLAGETALANHGLMSDTRIHTATG